MTVTASYAALLALMYMGISCWVVLLRRRHSVGIGDGKVHELKRAIRVHGNFAEYVPFGLLLLGFLEMLGEHPQLLHALGGSLVVARILHFRGLSANPGVSFGRFWGTSLTLLVMGIAAIRILILAA